ncbi:MAG: AAA family ATPase, partial [Gammaproteobacteria bacterium]
MPQSSQNPIIGRLEEQAILEQAYESLQAELIAIYGRRRVGKTYLVKEFFKQKPEKDCLFFYITGLKNATKKIQINLFMQELSTTFYGDSFIGKAKSWMDAIQELHKVIIQNTKQFSKKIIIFFDEVPWLADKKSGFLMALEYYWNRHWSDNPLVKIMLCGSSASWIVNKVVRNKGGLHNRITHRIELMPFKLLETKKFLEAQNFKLSLFLILKLYFFIGGIPYYLKQLNPDYSVDENINKLFFEKKGLFFDEFDEVFSSLFDHANTYKELVTLVAKARYGISRQDLEKKIKLN